jgi:hypothetical protein
MASLAGPPLMSPVPGRHLIKADSLLNFNLNMAQLKKAEQSWTKHGNTRRI